MSVEAAKSWLQVGIPYGEAPQSAKQQRSEPALTLEPRSGEIRDKAKEKKTKKENHPHKLFK